MMIYYLFLLIAALIVITMILWLFGRITHASSHRRSTKAAGNSMDPTSHLEGIADNLGPKSNKANPGRARDNQARGTSAQTHPAASSGSPSGLAPEKKPKVTDFRHAHVYADSSKSEARFWGSGVNPNWQSQQEGK